MVTQASAIWVSAIMKMNTWAWQGVQAGGGGSRGGLGGSGTAAAAAAAGAAAAAIAAAAPRLDDRQLAPKRLAAGPARLRRRVAAVRIQRCVGRQHAAPPVAAAGGGGERRRRRGGVLRAVPAAAAPAVDADLEQVALEGHQHEGQQAQHQQLVLQAAHHVPQRALLARLQVPVQRPARGPAGAGARLMAARAAVGAAETAQVREAGTGQARGECSGCNGAARPPLPSAPSSRCLPRPPPLPTWSPSPRPAPGSGR